jgi:DNA repair exonuclease SbcCD ATPase subunit
MTAIRTNPTIRHAAVIAGIVTAIVLGALSVRAAAAWTASSATLASAPVSVETLQAKLSDEQARSAALEEQLGALTARSGELSSALSTAQDRIGADTAAASDLRSKLAEAQKKLAALAATMKAASVRRTVVTTVVGPSTTTPAPAGAPAGGSDD